MIGMSFRIVIGICVAAVLTPELDLPKLCAVFGMGYGIGVINEMYRPNR